MLAQGDSSFMQYAAEVSEQVCNYNPFWKFWQQRIFGKNKKKPARAPSQREIFLCDQGHTILRSFPYHLIYYNNSYGDWWGLPKELWSGKSAYPSNTISMDIRRWMGAREEDGP